MRRLCQTIIVIFSLLMAFQAHADGMVFATDEDLQAFDNAVKESQGKNKGLKIGQKLDKSNPKEIGEQVLDLVRQENRNADKALEQRGQKGTGAGMSGRSGQAPGQQIRGEAPGRPAEVGKGKGKRPSKDK